MSSNSRLVAVIFCSTFFLLGNAFGQKAAIQADVKGVDGRPAKAAQVRIERQDKKTALILVKTDWRGRMAVANLEAGTYKLTVIVVGGVQSSQIVKAQTQKPLLLTFDLTKASATAGKGKKRMVYVPAPTGTRIGGGWVEIDDNGQPTPGQKGDNVDTLSGNALDRINTHISNPPSTGGH